MDVYKWEKDDLLSEINKLNARVKELEFALSESRKREEILRRNEERFHMAMKGTDDGLWDWNLLTDEVYYSPRWKSMLGYSEEELPHHLNTWKMLVHNEDIDITLAMIDDFHNGKDEKLEVEFRMKHKEGHYIHILSRSFLVRREDGTPVRMAGTHIDNTERKKAEDALREQLSMKEQFARIAASVPGSIHSYRLATDGTLTMPFSTPAIEDLYGITQKVLSEDLTPFFQNIHRDDIIQMKEKLDEVARLVSPWHDQFRYIHPEKGVRWMEGWSMPEVEKDGSIIWHGFVMDITERKMIENALKAGEERYRGTLDNMIEGCQIIGFDWKYIYVNESAAKHGKMKAEELSGHTVMEIYPGIEETELFSVMSLCMKERKSYTMENEFNYKDGSSAVFDLRFQPVPEGIFILSYDITDKKKAEKAFHESQNQLRAIIDNASAIIWLKDPEGRFLIANRYLEILLNMTHEEITGKTVFDIFPEELAEEYAFNDREVIKSGKPVEIEEHAMLPDGLHIFLSIKFPLLDVHGKVYALGAICTDITERKKAEELISKSEERFRSVVESAPDAIFIQTNRNFAYLNPAALSLFGISDENKLLGSHVIERFHPDYRASVMERIKELNEQKKAVPMIREKILKLDGTDVDVEVKAVPFAYRGQDGALVFIRDITERIKAEVELQKSEENYRDLYETAPVSYYSVSTSGEILRCNRTVRELLGYRAEELKGKKIFDLYSDTEHGKVKARKVFEKFLSGEQIRDEELQMKKSDGTPVWISLSVKPVIDSDGKVLESRSVVMNINERKEAEEIKKKLEEQLLHAQKLESVGRLAGGVAHDLNNLLTPILLYDEMLMDEFSPDDKKMNSLRQIQKAALRAQDLIRQLLAFSRKQILEFKPVDLNKILRSFEKLLRRTLREDIMIKVLLSPSVRLIKGDIGQLEQIIMNLSVNALDAMSDGGTLIIETSDTVFDNVYVSEHDGVEPGNYVLLSITDTGTGMDEETKRKIFEPFFTTKEQGRGTGLGLATVYGIVKQHGGHIWVYSEKGKGTIFKIYFPAIEFLPEIEDNKKMSDPVNKGTETVMIVEDNEILRDSTLMLLKKQGYNVLSASDGMDCMKVLSSYGGPIDLLLTDVVMPDMNGRELFGKVKTLYPSIKVLYMSGYSQNVIAHQGVLDEGIEFIQKPFSVRALSGRIRKILDF